MIHRVAEAGFGTDPNRYERGRPGYPAEAIDAILRFTELHPGDCILDLAAGTGKLTRLLPSENTIVAAEPVEAMRRYLAQRMPSVHVVSGLAEALPFATGSFRLLTVAQAFHWFDAPAAWRQFARVVVPGGAVALVWNARDRSVDWVDKIWSIMDRVEKNAPWRDHDTAQRFDTVGLFDRPEEHTFHHSVDATPQDIVDRVTSVSHVAVLSESARQAVVEEIHHTLTTHPDTAGRDHLTVRYRTDLYLFRRT